MKRKNSARSLPRILKRACPHSSSTRKTQNVVYAVSNIGRDKSAAVRYDLVQKKELEELYHNDIVDVDGIGYSRKRKVATSVYYTVDKRDFKFLDKESEARRAEMRKLFDKDLEFGIASSNKNEDKFLVVTYDDKTSECLLLLRP